VNGSSAGWGDESGDDDEDMVLSVFVAIATERFVVVSTRGKRDVVDDFFHDEERPGDDDDGPDNNFLIVVVDDVGIRNIIVNSEFFRFLCCTVKRFEEVCWYRSFLELILV
jgi:hypothetical protein